MKRVRSDVVIRTSGGFAGGLLIKEGKDEHDVNDDEQKGAESRIWKREGGCIPWCGP